MVSDILHTYTLFTYACGEIQWSATGSGRAAVVGYNAAGESFFNHALSGYSLIGDAVSCSVRENQQNEQMSRLLNTVTDSMSLHLPAESAAICCATILSADPISSLKVLKEVNDLVDPCPPTLYQARLDSARFRRQPDLPQCYVSMKKTVHFLGNMPHSITRQCCYSNRYI